MNEYLLTKGLTPSETNVVTHLMKGLSNKDIGTALNIRDKTVKFHLTNVYKKLQVKGRVGLIVSLLPTIAGEANHETLT